MIARDVLCVLKIDSYIPLRQNVAQRGTQPEIQRISRGREIVAGHTDEWTEREVVGESVSVIEQAHADQRVAIDRIPGSRSARTLLTFTPASTNSSAPCPSGAPP